MNNSARKTKNQPPDQPFSQPLENSPGHAPGQSAKSAAQSGQPHQSVQSGQFTQSGKPGRSAPPENPYRPTNPGNPGASGPAAQNEQTGSNEHTGPETPPAKAPESMGIIAHLAELRSRLIRALLVWIVVFFICWGFDKELAQIILAPIREALLSSGQSGKLITITLPEGFLSYLNVSFIISLFLSSPYLFYQAWTFASPGLKSHEKKNILPLALASALLFCAGALFAYFVIFPMAFSFFIEYAKDAASPEPSLRFYLSLALNTLLAFGFAFQLPLAIFFLAKLRVITPEGLARKRKYAIVGAFIVGAILTPPDPVSQILMALPLIGLYELSILLCRRVFAPGVKSQSAP